MLNVSGLEGGDGSEGLFDGLQESVPTPFIGVLVHRLPDAACYPYDERFGYRPPITGVARVQAVVACREVIVLFEGIFANQVSPSISGGSIDSVGILNELTEVTSIPKIREYDDEYPQ